MPKLLSTACLLSAAAWLTSVNQATASEWGCEVLLCASSSNPSWRGVPACHPPMNRLISAMRGWGFSWPTCPEAGTGRPGYETYDECPAGWNVGDSNQDHGSGQSDICVQVRNTCPSGFGGREDCQQTVTMPRPVREDPYFFDITHDDGNITRHWFNLRP
ncbi:MAG: hypothetical protein KKD02_11575 [Alphaproteobacteria bacterium]|nr:hypothetical protein [Alphaproteobacteria bacterium]